MRGCKGDTVNLDFRGKELREAARGIDRARGTVAVTCRACRKHAARPAPDVAASQYFAAAAPRLSGHPACAGVGRCNGAAGPATWYKQGDGSWTRVTRLPPGLDAAESPWGAGDLVSGDKTQQSGLPTLAVASAKLRPPRPQVPLVTRRALLAELLAATQPLVVVCAPAGSGKSVALMQWVEADPRPAAWVQLDSSDDDVVLLLACLCGALEPLTDLDPGVAASLSLLVPPVRERVLPLLSAAVSAAKPFLLVLDDAHVLRSQKCWDVLALLLRALPAGAQIALGSRSDPPLALPRLRAAGELTEVRMPGLALDKAEVEEFVLLHECTLDDRSVDQLLAATEGWATGLQLACLASAGRPLQEWLPKVSGGRRDIAAYLTSEVLDGQPADVQEFLLSTSVLGELTPALCRRITGRDDAGELLARIAREGLFVVPVGDEADRYRYHNLFAEMLAAELERRRPGTPAELHRLVAAWYAERDDPDAQVRHLLAAGEAAAAGAVVCDSWTTLWSRGQAETVRRWLGSFSDRQILAQPALTVTAGWVYSALDDRKLGERWGRAACSARVDDGEAQPEHGPSLLALQALLRATIGLDGVRAMRTDAELAARLEAFPDTSWYADAQVSLGVARWLSGSAQRALHPLAVGAREGSVRNASAELAAVGYLALIAADEGEWEAAGEHEARAAARFVELGFGTSRRCLPMMLARVRLLARSPEHGIDAAVAAVDDLMTHMVPHPWMELLTSVVLGEAAVEVGDAAAAKRRAASAAAQLARYPDAGILTRRAEHLRAAVELTHVSEALTPAERRVLELLPTHFTEQEIAERLFVSHNTVKTHLKCVYRKLGASSRSEAVRLAHDAGLLSLP